MTAAAVMSTPITVAALSRDGSRVAVADGRSVCLWETATGNRLHEIEGSKPFILLAFSQDGGSLAGVDVEKSVSVWNVASGRGVTRLAARVTGPEIEVAVNSSFGVAALSADLEFLAWNHLDVKAMRAWVRLTAVADGTEPRGNPFLNELPPALVFMPDGRSLIWAGNDQNVHVTEIATGKETLRTEKAGVNGPISGLTLGPDGKMLALVRMVDGQARVQARALEHRHREAGSMRSSRPTSRSLPLPKGSESSSRGASLGRCPSVLARRHELGGRAGRAGGHPAF